MVANAESATIGVVDVDSRSIIGAIDVKPARTKAEAPGAPNYAQDTDVSPDGRTVYVSRGYMGDVAAFDIAGGKMLWQRSLNTGRADHMTISPDGRSLFVSAMMDNRVYKLSAATGEPAGPRPPLCLAGRASDYAALVRAPELTLIATVPVGDAPGWAEVSLDGRMCLVANTRSDDLSIISIADRREVARLPIGNSPKHITVTRLPAAVVAAMKARPAS